MPVSGRSPHNPFIGTFRTCDGGTIALNTLTPGPYIRDIFTHLGLAELADDPRFSTARPARSASPPTLSDDILMARRKTDQERARVERHAAEGPDRRGEVLHRTRDLRRGGRGHRGGGEQTGSERAHQAWWKRRGSGHSQGRLSGSTSISGAM